MPQTAKKSINLLSDQYREPKNYQFISQASIVTLSVYIFILILIFGISFFLTTQKNNQTQLNNQLSSSIQQKKDVEELVTTVKNRAAIAKSVFEKTGPSSSDLINALVSLLPQGVSMMNLTVDKDGKVSMIVRSQNSQGVKDFLDKMRSTQYSSVVMNTLALNTEGYYIVSIDIRP